MNPSEKKPAPRGGLRSLVAFVMPALIGLVVVGAVIAWKQELFVTRTPIYIFTDSALGITKGIPVKVFGLTVGTVDEICADLVARRERFGFSYVCVSQGAMEAFAPVVQRLTGT